MQCKVSKVAPEDHQKLTDAETLVEASNDASRDDTEDVEVARLILSPRQELSLQGCSVRSLREQSFQVSGPRLFNSIPKEVRNMTKVSVEEFKEKLDKFLEKIPDQPNVDGLTPTACNPFNAAPSNSIVDQARTILPHRRPVA